MEGGKVLFASYCNHIILPPFPEKKGIHNMMCALPFMF